MSIKEWTMEKLSEQEILDEIASRRCGEDVDVLRNRIQELDGKISEYYQHIRWVALSLGKALSNTASAEAKLRELVEAAEWRDECNALYSGMYQDWLCDDDEVSESQDWMESIFDISEAAETAYQAALNAAREG